MDEEHTMFALKKLIPAVLGAVGTAGLVAVSLAPAGTATASAGPTCQLTVHSNKVLNLEDNGVDDEIFFKLGTSRTPVRQYAQNQRRNNIGSETFQGTIDLKVFERDAGNLTRVDTLNNIPCANTPLEVDDLTDGDGIYRVRWSVS
ncbi:hypothetical protein [Nocardioides sp. GXQ0305]|uniref:hypothetical protein n=1 Tax=Nocardioides sp. GXQ0305 TaxID=3423912 RepID=UPI003D7C6B9B